MADINKYTTKEVLNKVLLDSSGNAVDAYTHTSQESLNAVLDATNNRLNINLKGGTISGDVTISGDLTVSGGGDFNFSEVLTGDMVIQDTTNNATGGVLRLQNTRGGSAGSDGDDAGTISFYASDAGSNSEEMSTILSEVALNTTGSTAGKLTFKAMASNSSTALLTLAGWAGGSHSSTVSSAVFNTSLVEIQGGLTTTGAVLTLSTKEPTIVANDVLGKINFQSPLDTGADSDLVGASIHALATDTFSDTVNATDLIFSTGASETATEKMRIASTGAITLAGTLTVNGTNTTIANATNPYLYINDTNAGAAIFQQSGNDTRIGSDSNTQVLFVQSNATAMTISTDKYLGIGTSSPATNLHVKTTAGNHGIEIESDSAAVLTFDHAGNDEGRILFNEADTTEGSIIYTSTGTDTMQFKVGSNALRFKIDENSRISLSNNDTGTSSTVFGYLAGMPGSSNALGNVFIGQEAGENVGSSDTDGNVMIGYRAGRGTFTDATDHNVGIGYTALNVLTSGHGNVAMGSGAGIAIQDAESNVAIGRNALGQVVSSNQSIAIGFNSGYGLTTGANNTVIGAEALYNSADIDRAVVIGKNALYAGNATSGADGTIAIGYDAARALTSGGQNIAIGYEALHDCTTGRRNTVIGYQAADTLTAGSDDNTAVGYAALGAGNHDTTHQNSCFGYGAGDTITTGSNNTCLGSQANVSASGAVGQIAIGQAVTCTADNTATLGIGSNTASLGLDGSDTSWAAASSDKRLKENIETSSAGLDVINDLRPVTYNWKKAKDVDNGMPQYKDSEEPVLGLEYGETLHGFIAQEVKEVVDNHSSLKEGFKMWKLKDDGTQTVADGNLIPILVKAVQELTAKVEELEKK